MTSWDEMSKVEQLAATYYDLYKDAHGIRPRWIYGVHEVTGEVGCVYSEEEMGEMLDRLHVEAQEIWDQEASEEAERVANFEAKLVELQALGANDRETAILWFVQSLDLDQWELQYGGERICYSLGLPYKMQTMFDPAVNKVLNEMTEEVA